MFKLSTFFKIALATFIETNLTLGTESFIYFIIIGAILSYTISFGRDYDAKLRA